MNFQKDFNCYICINACIGQLNYLATNLDRKFEISQIVQEGTH